MQTLLRSPLPVVVPIDDPEPDQLCHRCGTPNIEDFIKIGRDEWTPICAACRAALRADTDLDRLWRRYRSAAMRRRQGIAARADRRNALARMSAAVGRGVWAVREEAA